MDRYETTLLTTVEEDFNKTYSMIFLCKGPNITAELALSEYEKWISSLLLSVIIFIGSLANPIMVICIYRIWSTNISMCRNLFHLAIGDMIRVFFCLPIRAFTYFQLITFSSKVMLVFKIWIFLDIFTEILQLFILLLISSDRYYAVAKPFKKYNDQKRISFTLICSWTLSIVGASCASYFYEDYLKIIEACEINIMLYLLISLYLMFELGIVIGILQFYLRTIYFLYKQKMKMQILKRKKVHPFTTHSDVKEKNITHPKKILSKSVTGEKEEMMNNVVHPRVVDFAVTDFRYPETKAPQKERQTEIKNDSDLSKGLSNSANILPTSHILLPMNLSRDVNESATKWNPPKEKPESVATDFKYGEIEDLKMDATADIATEVLKNSQEDDGTPRLDIVINCMLDGIATQTEIVDDQKSSVISTNKGRSSLCRANEVGETAVNLVADTNVENETAWAKSEFSSANDWNSTPTTIETEKLFIISQQVEFTVKSVSTLSADVKEDVNRPGSCSNESGLLLEKGFIIPTGENEEAIKSNNLQNIEAETPTQTKSYKENENQKVTLTRKTEKRKRNAVAKFSGNNLLRTTNRITTLKNRIEKTFQLTTRQGRAISITSPFSMMSKSCKLKQRYHKEVQITQRITIFMIILVLCWMPLYITRFLQVSYLLNDQCCFYKHYKTLWWEFLSAFTSAFNPCLYGILNIQLRNEFYRLVRRFRNLLMNCRCCN